MAAKRIGAIVVTLGMLVATTSIARPIPRHCTITLTRPMFIHAVQATYKGTRLPRHGAYRRLWRYSRCGGNGPRGYRIRWARRVWGIGLSRWKSRRYDAQFTGFVVSGRTSTFGPPSDGSGTTADGGTDDRPCIALRSDATLDHMFLVTIYGHSARLIQCDWGPAEWTGVAIDVTGAGDEALGLPPGNYYGTARELR